jgi:hypothetical protein
VTDVVRLGRELKAAVEVYESIARRHAGQQHATAASAADIAAWTFDALDRHGDRTPEDRRRELLDLADDLQARTRTRTSMFGPWVKRSGSCGVEHRPSERPTGGSGYTSRPMDTHARTLLLDGLAELEISSRCDGDADRLCALVDLVAEWE